MQKSVLILSFLLISTLSLLAQPPGTLWTQTYGGEGFDALTSFAETSDGGYILAGSTNSGQIWLIRTDSEGEEEWSQTYSGSSWSGEGGSWYSTSGTHVIQAIDGGFAFIWSSVSGDHYGDTSSSFHLVKTDSNGEEEWRDTTTDSDSGLRPLSLQQTIDSGFILSYVWNDMGPWSFVVSKKDSSGITEWSRELFIVSSGLGDVRQVDDGGYIVVAGTSLFDDPDNIQLIKLDSSGEEDWVQVFGGDEEGTGFKAQQTDDGGYILVGGTRSFGAGNSDAWLIKTDSSGEEEWSQTFGGVNFDGLYDIQQTGDNGYIMAGSTFSFGAGSQDGWLLKTDSFGEEEWSQAFGGNDYDGFWGVLQTNDGGYSAVGFTNSSGAGSSDGWVVHIAQFYDVAESSSQKPSEFTLDKVFPNPFNSTTNISVGLPELSDLRISVFNIVGQEIAVIANASYSEGFHNFTFNADNLSSGVYFVQASVPGQMNELRKIVLLR